MVALQTTTPSLGPSLVFLVLFVVAGGVLGAVGSAVVRRLSNPVGKYRLLYAGVLVPFALLSYGVLALLGFGGAAVAAAGVSGPLGSVIGDVAETLGAGVVWLSAYAPTIRGVRAVRDIDLSTTTALARMARYVVGVSVVVAVVLFPLHLGSDGVSPLGLAGVVAGLILVLVVAAPWLVAALRSTTTPSGATRERLERLRRRAGLDVRDTRVLDTEDEETAAVYVRGPPGYRRLFVTSTVLDRFDDETATALLAVQAGHVRARLLARRVGTVVLGAGLLVAAVAGWGSRWPTLGAAVGVVLIGFWLSRRGVRTADDVAADVVGSDTVADAFERYADVHALEPTRRRVPNPLSITVALGDRIDRLRGR